MLFHSRGLTFLIRLSTGRKGWFGPLLWPGLSDRLTDSSAKMSDLAFYLKISCAESFDIDVSRFLEAWPSIFELLRFESALTS